VKVERESPLSSLDLTKLHYYKHPRLLSPLIHPLFNMAETPSPIVTTPSPIITTEISWTETDAEKGTTVSMPHFGGIMTSEFDGKTIIFAWSGSDPDSDTQCFTYKEVDETWTYPDKANYDAAKPRRKGAEHIGMYRMPGFKYSTKIKETCTSFTGTSPYNGITPKDESPTMTLTNYKQSTRRHMIINGLYDIFVIVNPAGKKFDLFSSHSLFLEDDIKEHVMALRATGCLLVIENLMYSGTYLRNSIDATLYQKVIEDSGVNATGPEVFGSLMKILYSDSFEAIDQCRATLKTIHLSDFPGENVELCCSKIELLAERLDCAGAFDMDQLLIVVKIMEGAADERFRAWATTQFRHFNDIAKKLRVYHVSTLKDPMPRWDTFLKECRTEYREMIGQKRWTPQVDAGQQSALEPNLPAAYMMRAMVASLKQMGIDGNDPATIQALVAGHLQQQGPGAGANTSRKCFRCGSTDHVIANCPAVDSSTTQGQRGQSQQQGRDGWKYIAPTSGTEATATLNRGGRKYVWCTKCGKWMYHKADTHDAWTQRAAARAAAGIAPGAPLPPAAATAVQPVAHLAAITQDDDDDWLSFGGLRF
jgi:hypothetical protein